MSKLATLIAIIFLPVMVVVALLNERRIRKQFKNYEH